MFEFDPVMEKIYSKCVPFDEGSIGSGEDHKRIHKELGAIRAFLERRDPEVMACIDGYVDKYLELVDLECRHYFAEGYRLGTGKVVQLRNISMSSKDKPS